MPTLDELRSDFERRRNRSLSMPISGAIVWLVVAMAGGILPPWSASLFLAFATGAIFPIALVIAKFRREELVSSANPLAKLMGIFLGAFTAPLLFMAAGLPGGRIFLGPAQR